MAYRAIGVQKEETGHCHNTRENEQNKKWTPCCNQTRYSQCQNAKTDQNHQIARGGRVTFFVIHIYDIKMILYQYYA